MARPAGLSSDEEFSDDGLSFGDSPPTRRRVVLNDLISNTKESPDDTVEKKLIDAIIGKNLEEVTRLVKVEGANINAKVGTVTKWTPLLYACSLGSVAIVKELLQLGADLNIHFELFTPLMALCDSTQKNENDLIECLEVLLEHGADVHSLDWCHCNALSYAVKRGHERLILKLLSLECDVNNVDGDGWSPIFYAVDSGNAQIIQILKDAGANLNLYDKRGRCLYDIAVLKNYKEIVDMVSTMERHPELDEVIDTKQDVGMTNYKYVLSELPNRKKGRFSGFPTDALKIVNGIGLQNLLKVFVEKDIQLGQMLTMDDNQWKDVGVQMSFDRMKLMQSAQMFHERHWGRTSLGSNFVDEEVTLFIAAQVLCNIARQLHVISIATYYWNANKNASGYVNKDLEIYIAKGLSHIDNMYKEIDLILKLVKDIEKEQDITPADLIKPAVESRRKMGLSVISVCLISSFIIYKYNFIKLLPSMLSSFTKHTL